MQPDEQRKARKNRRRIRWNTLRILSGWNDSAGRGSFARVERSMSDRLLGLIYRCANLSVAGHSLLASKSTISATLYLIPPTARRVSRTRHHQPGHTSPPPDPPAYVRQKYLKRGPSQNPVGWSAPHRHRNKIHGGECGDAEIDYPKGTVNQDSRL